MTQNGKFWEAYKLFYGDHFYGGSGIVEDRSVESSSEIGITETSVLVHVPRKMYGLSFRIATRMQLRTFLQSYIADVEGLDEKAAQEGVQKESFTSFGGVKMRCEEELQEVAGMFEGHRCWAGARCASYISA